MVREQQVIDIRNKESRQNFIDLLQKRNYTLVDFNINDIISSTFPIVVNLKNRVISMLGNITTSASAVSSGIIMNEEAFWKECAKWHIERLFEKSSNQIISNIYTIEEIKQDYNLVPKENGIYVIVDLGKTCIEFLENRPLLNEKDSIYFNSELENKYKLGDKTILYIGKADREKGLNSRLKEYIEFGYGINKPHLGGRAIWQIKNNKQLGICWIKVEESESIETQMITKYKNLYNVLPLANYRI